MPLVLIIISFFTAIIFYPLMPTTMAAHWNLYGQVDGYSPRNFGVFFMPVLILAIYLLFKFLPLIDPYKKNFLQFKKYYDNFIVIILGFLFYLYLLTLFANIYSFNLVRFLPPAFTILFYYAGVLMSVARQNWFVGFRTPWTLSNLTVWNKTHLLGSRLFKISALIMLFGLILPEFAIFFILLPILLVSLALFVYSYVIYPRQ